MREADTDVFIALDLDRTLLNTELYVKTVDRGDTTISPEKLLNPGARTLLEQLATRAIAHGIVTCETEPGRQLPKLMRAGIDALPYLITTKPHKAEMMRQWWQDDGFVIPPELSRGKPLKAQAIWIIDDKADAFTDMDPDRMRGFCTALRELLFALIKQVI